MRSARAKPPSHGGASTRPLWLPWLSRIRVHGILQPLVVRPLPDGAVAAADGAAYEIVAGERRWRAAFAAGLRTVPVVVRELSDDAALQTALVENLQRAELTPVEEARGYRLLAERFGLSHEEIGRRVSKSRPHVANLLRLLSLPSSVLEAIDGGLLTFAHGRLLLRSDNPARDARRAIQAKMTVAALERHLAKQRADEGAGRGARAGRQDAGPLAREAQGWIEDTAAALAFALEEKTGAPVALKLRPPLQGRLSIKLRDAGDLYRVAAALLSAEIPPPPPAPALERLLARCWREGVDPVAVFTEEGGVREDEGGREGARGKEKAREAPEPPET